MSIQSQKLPLKTFLATGGKLENPDLVKWDVAQEVLLETASGQDFALILGIPREGTSNLIWEDVYRHALVYYHLGFKTFVAYDDSFTVIKRVFTAFSQAIKKQGANIDTVSIIVCGEYNFKSGEYIRFQGHDCNFLDDLIHDIGDRSENFKGKNWPFILRWSENALGDAKPRGNAFFRIEHKRIDSLVPSDYYTQSNYARGVPIFLHFIMEEPGSVHQALGLDKHPVHWRILESLPTHKDPEPIWTLGLILGLAHDAFEERRELIRQIVTSPEKFDEIETKLSQANFHNKPDSLRVWLTCWTIIEWKITDEKEKRIAICRKLLNRLAKIDPEKFGRHWDNVKAILKVQICQEAVLDSIKYIFESDSVESVNGKEKRAIPWKRLREIIEEDGFSDGKTWKSVSKALFEQFERQEQKILAQDNVGVEREQIIQQLGDKILKQEELLGKIEDLRKDVTQTEAKTEKRISELDFLLTVNLSILITANVIIFITIYLSWIGIL